MTTEEGVEAGLLCPECGGSEEDFILEEVDIGVGIQTNLCHGSFHAAAMERYRKSPGNPGSFTGR